jgi:hypothetical protein
MSDEVELKYLFTAIFSDGSFIIQEPSDVSKIDPTKSQFYDVKLREDDLIEFVLYSSVDDHTISVRLDTGTFMASNNSLNNPVIFSAGDLRNNFPPDTKYRIIFLRRHTHTFSSDNIELGHDVEYIIGWQCTVDGKNFQQTMIVI